MSCSLEQTEQERCILCGAETSSFGSRSIESGWLCGECVGKMSPWFHCRQDSSKEELLEHITSRERNREIIPLFHPTLRLWKNPTVYLDDVQRLFSVSDALLKDFPLENPDILEYRQVLQCDVEIEEHRTELKKFSPGMGRVSYRPRRYDYRFNIWVRILLEHPFLHELRFCMNPRPVMVKSKDVEASVQGKVVKSREYQSCVQMAKEIQAVLLKARDLARADDAEKSTEHPAAEQGETSAV